VLMQGTMPRCKSDLLGASDWCCREARCPESTYVRGKPWPSCDRANGAAWSVARSRDEAPYSRRRAIGDVVSTIEASTGERQAAGSRLRMLAMQRLRGHRDECRFEARADPVPLEAMFGHSCAYHRGINATLIQNAVLADCDLADSPPTSLRSRSARHAAASAEIDASVLASMNLVRV